MFRTVHIDREGKLLADVSEYAARHDVIYLSPARRALDGLPLGTGSMGGLVYHTDRALCQRVCRTDSFDHARKEGRFGAWAHEWEEETTALASCGLVRIEDGAPSFAWEYLQDYRMHLDLGKAEIRAEASSPLSSFRARGFGSRESGCLCWEVSFASPEPLERRVVLERYGTRGFFHAYETVSRDPGRRLSGISSRALDGAMLITQRLSGTVFTTAVRVEGPGAVVRVKNSRELETVLPASDRISFRVLIATALSHGEEDTEKEALEKLSAASEAGFDALRAAHRARWKELWNRSFLSVGDEFAEFLWYLNRYQFASAGFGAFPPSVFGSLWTAFGDARNWGHFYHWNDQMQFWPVDAWDEGELAESYFAFRRKMLPKARADAKALFGIDGAWFSDIASAEGDQAVEPDTARNMTCGSMIALSAWRHYRHYPDREFLLETALPLMKAAADAWRGLLAPGEDGRLHLRDVTALEGYLMLSDTLTDWAMIRALFKALLSLPPEAGLSGEEREAFEALLEKLYEPPTVEKEGKTLFAYGRRADGSPVVDAEYPESGMGVGPVGALMPVFPASLYGLGSEEDPWSGIARESAAALKAHRSTVGWDPAGIVFARMGFREETRDFIRDALEKYVIFPSGLTHYNPGELESPYFPRMISPESQSTPWDELHEKDRGERVRLDPVRFAHFYSEPMGVLSAALNESLLQSHAGHVRVFPAAGDGLFRLHAEGDFMVTAEKKDGRVLYVAAESRRGGLFTLQSPFSSAETVRSGREEIPFTSETRAGERFLSFPTEAGRTYLIFSRDLHIDGSYPTRVPLSPACGPKTFGKRTVGLPRDF